MTNELIDIQSARALLSDVTVPEGDEYDEEYWTIEGARRYLRNREAELMCEDIPTLLVREMHGSLAKLMRPTYVSMEEAIATIQRANGKGVA